eukprot:scaffold12306_cov109-Cylindrotheca_fusiformis.AAC.4
MENKDVGEHDDDDDNLDSHWLPLSSWATFGMLLLSLNKKSEYCNRPQELLSRIRQQKPSDAVSRPKSIHDARFNFLTHSDEESSRKMNS